MLAASCRDDPAAIAPQRAVGWLAEALLAELDEDRGRLFEACRCGLRVIEGHAAAMAAFELRVHAFGLAAELADTAIGAALATGDSRLVLRWTERYRASAVSRRSLRPPSDPQLHTALVELRAAVAALRDSGSADPRASMARVSECEARVRHRAMLADGDTRGLGTSSEFDAVCAELGEAVLVSYFGHNGQIYMCSIVDGLVRLSLVGDDSEIAGEVERLQYCLARRAEASSPRIHEAFATAARRSAEVLDEALLRPVLPDLAQGRPLVVVPTGRLHGMAWAELPSCRRRGVTVTPSLRCWLRAASDARERQGGNQQVWVAGPGLEHAKREVRALHAVSGGRLLADGQATAERVMTAVDGAGTVHIAAHGWFRDDQPLLSCLDLADGPLFGYDLDRLRRAPTTVVLSACEVGRSAVSRGDELSGLAAALLGRGTATLIASVVPVPDERTAEVMMSLHAGLRRGLAPATALAHAQAEHGESGFLCLGFGGR